MSVRRRWDRALTGRLGIGLMLIAIRILAGDDPPPRTTVWNFLPAAEFYPYAIADPLRPQNALMGLCFLDSDIPESGDRRFSLRLGGRFPIVRMHPAGESDRGWQLDFEGGFVGQFDVEHKLDNLGWDGHYGLMLSYKPSATVGFRFGTLHDSAHLGDEYHERTGRERIGYTREELAVATSWKPDPHWHLYAEGGYAPSPKEFQDRLRIQAGVEYLGVTEWRKGNNGWYAALDLRSYEENDWEVRAVGQFGLLIPTGFGTNKYRVALEVGVGRSVLGEFYAYRETYAALGWYLDL